MESPNTEERNIWEAVGILCAGYHLRPCEAYEAISLTAAVMDLSPDDVAEHGQWNGVLPYLDSWPGRPPA